jgi:transglutaminase-like putative cysteine protease
LASGATSAAIVTAALGTAVVALLQRRGALAIAVGVAVVAVSSLWWGVHTETHGGLPTLHGLSEVRRSLQAARLPLAAFHLPLVHTPGIVALCALTAGLAAVAGRALGTRYPALSLVPAGGLLVGSAILLPTTAAGLLGLVLGALGFMVVGGSRRAARRTLAVVAAVSLGAAALTVVWAAAGTGSGAVSPGGRIVPAVAPSALSLATDLTGVETKDANVVLFTARSPISTYWQVTALSTYVDGQWVPDQATEAVLGGATPAVPSVPTADLHLFTARITLSAYSGRLLPAPPSTVEATGAPSLVVTPAGVVATAALRPGGSYTATATVPAAVSDLPAVAPSPSADTAVGPVPAVVRALALSITAGQSTPLEKAEALTDYFRSGRFHYAVGASLRSSADSLVTFLTRTRTGSCEQFAGAFAVLARVSGLAARVAVGFTPGRPSGGVSVVRGGDAHAWPQVLVDGNWVSFEPTPQLPSGELSPPGVLGPTGLGQPNPTGPGSLPHVSIPKLPIASPTAPPTTVRAPVSARPSSGGAPWVIGVVVAALTAGVIALWFLRRRTPMDRLVRSWRAIDRTLARRGLARPPSSTPMGHVRALSGHRAGEQATATLGDMTIVATIIESVNYGFAELSPEDVTRAAGASRRARRAILSGALSYPTEPGFEVFGAPGRSGVTTDPELRVEVGSDPQDGVGSRRS